MIIAQNYLKVNAFVGEELVVKVVLDLLHFGGDVYLVEQILGEVAAGQAEAGAGVLSLE